MGTEPRGAWECSTCGTRPHVGTHCMCHGIFVDRDGKAYSDDLPTTGVYVGDDDSTEDSNHGC